jgi:hypothetical protein
MKDWTEYKPVISIYAIMYKEIVRKTLFYSAIFFTGYSTHYFLN